MGTFIHERFRLEPFDDKNQREDLTQYIAQEQKLDAMMFLLIVGENRMRMVLWSKCNINKISYWYGNKTINWWWTSRLFLEIIKNPVMNVEFLNPFTKQWTSITAIERLGPLLICLIWAKMIILELFIWSGTISHRM